MISYLRFMSFYNLLAILLVATAGFSYLNHRFIRLPGTIGVLLLSLVFSLLLVAGGTVFPKTFETAVSVVRDIDFGKLLLEVLLSFLLFAGAIHVDIGKLRREKASIMTFATAGVLLSTALVGTLMYLLLPLLGLKADLIYCFLFGALISPTDPIAVLGILKNARIPSSLETKITGESLFNDGVGVVVFLSILEVASLGPGKLTAGDIALLFLKEAVGGIAWGLILGWCCYLLLRSVDHYQLEVLLTLAMVMGGYALADSLHISGPLAMVVAGIIIGNRGKELAMSDITRDYLGKFWELIDEILNALLFLLIGLEMLVIPFGGQIAWIGLLTIPVVLLARWFSVLLPGWLLSIRKPFENNAIALLTWGGLRGGISVALALAIPSNMHRDIFLPVTYMVVIFSILVQGLTIAPLARRLGATDKKE